MKIPFSLPGNFEKTILELAKTREKAAKQKYLLDLGESLVMHLCSFVLGEYKESRLVSVELEKSFLKNNKNISFGIYLGWLRESSKFLYKSNAPSRIHSLIHGSNEWNETWKFIKGFEALKRQIDKGAVEGFETIVQDAFRNNPAKVNIIQFFDTFIQLRNRVAHPHKEVNGINISWPFSEDYFDTINPLLEGALQRSMQELNQIWEYRKYTIESNEDGILLLLNEDSGEYEEFAVKTDINDGIKVFANAENNILISDWKVLLKAGDKALEEIRKEEEALRNKASIEELKESIKAALDDGQISLEEFNFFESLGKTKLGLNRQDLKNIIVEVASYMQIEDPFPEVDKRFVAAIDEAIRNKTYNDFILKLTGQQYGVDAEQFEKVFAERAAALGADPEEVRKNRILQFSHDELKIFQGLLMAWQWLGNIYQFNKNNSESQYKITGDSYQYGTKEYWHRSAFQAVDQFVQSRLEKLALTDETEWDTKQNNWQIGVMTSYAWCSAFPKKAVSLRILSLHFSLYADRTAAIGFLPDWKDYKLLEKYGLMLDIFCRHLKDFAVEYENELKKYNNLYLWDGVNNRPLHSFSEMMKSNEWYFLHMYGFDQIQFYYSAKEIENNPAVLLEGFDIVFNLFGGLFEKVNRDYVNLLNDTTEIETREEAVIKKLKDLIPLLADYGLTTAEAAVASENRDEENNQEGHSGIDSQGLKGSCQLGFFALEFKEKIKGYPVLLRFQFRQNYLTGKLNFNTIISVAGEAETSIHLPAEQVLSKLTEHAFSGCEAHHYKGKYILNFEVEDITEFDPTPIVFEFMNAFTLLLAEQKLDILGIKIHDPRFETQKEQINQMLDVMQLNVSPHFSNQIYKERNIMKGKRHIDYVYSNKKVTHYLGWGTELTQTDLQDILVFHVKDTIKGAHLVQLMQDFVKERPEWSYSETESADREEARWLGESMREMELSASSEYNRNYAARHAIIDNPNNYWCAKIKDNKQWFQVKLKETAEVTSIKLQGSAKHNSFIKQFDLMFSINGKEWKTLPGITGLESTDQEKEIILEKPVKAAFIRITPIDFNGFPALRLDIKKRNLTAGSAELYYRCPGNTGEGNSMQVIQKHIEVFLPYFRNYIGF
jgi:hypothetical protein